MFAVAPEDTYNSAHEAPAARPMKRILAVILLATALSLAATCVTYSLGIDTFDLSRPNGKGGKTDDTIRLRLAPGATKRDVFYVTNVGDKTVKLFVYPAGGAPAANGGVALAGRLEPRTGLAKWVTMRAYSLSLAPKETRTVNYSITVPKAAIHEESVGGIVAELAKPVKSKAKGKMRINVLPRAAILITQRVQGPLIEKMRLLKFGRPWEGKKIRFDFLLKNLGNVHENTGAKVNIYNYLTKRKVDTLATPNLGTVFPRRTAHLSALWVRTPLIGLYKADAKITYGRAKNRKLNGSITILIFPWWIILLIVAVILLVMWSAWRRLRRLPGRHSTTVAAAAFPPASR